MIPAIAALVQVVGSKSLKCTWMGYAHSLDDFYQNILQTTVDCCMARLGWTWEWVGRVRVSVYFVGVFLGEIKSATSSWHH